MERNLYSAPEASPADLPGAVVHAEGRRYYTPWQITVATLVGGSLAGGYLALRNHIAFADKRNAVVILIVSVVVLVGSIAAGIMMPPHVSRSAGALLIAIAYRWYAEAAFASRIEIAKVGGWSQYSWWRVIGISVAILAGMLLMLLLGMLVIDHEALPAHSV
jgi:hypothetical protein